MGNRCLLLQVVTPHFHRDEVLQEMRELEQLVETFGGKIIDKSVQHKVHPHPDTYIGPGKVKWLIEEVKKNDIDIVILNDVVKTGQLFRLEKELWSVNTAIAVWDRVDLILKIFEQHATTTEAKLQIELARIQHLGPRIYGLGGTVLSRQGGGIGTRGMGETNLEKERRTIKKRTQQIKKQLTQRAKSLENKRDQRRLKGMQTVALVGYTSAGKTTLFNTLTSKERTTHSGLFTTLDSVVGKLKITEAMPGVLISDTIGFIDKLPTFLIEAFRSTLEESLEAKLLLHVVDAADSKVNEKIATVDTILQELGVENPARLVFNKIDVLRDTAIIKLEEKFADRQPIFLSAKTKDGIPALKDLIKKEILGVKTTTE